MITQPRIDPQMSLNRALQAVSIMTGHRNARREQTNADVVHAAVAASIHKVCIDKVTMQLSISFYCFYLNCKNGSGSSAA